MAISLPNRSFSPMRLDAPLDEKGPHHKQSMWHRLGFRRWLGRESRDASPERTTRRQPPPLTPHNDHSTLDRIPASADHFSRAKQDNLTRRISRKVGVGLPRSSTFKRQHIEERDRDRLAPLEPDHRRAQSADRHPLSVERTRSCSPLPAVGPRLSAPEVQWLGPAPASTVDLACDLNDESDLPADWENPSYQDVTFPPSEIETDRDTIPESQMQTQLQASEAEPSPMHDDLEMELEKRWILNLSMHFRDNSGREKFFVTYAETPTKWRRVTISMDYHSAPPDSLEREVEGLRYQRDKCARIYESIRESLAEIQFYDTVTNLKVETLDGRLHVHVTEDVNEMIPYPPITSIRHLRGARRVPEHFLRFESHLSGFVYKVQLGGRPYIKKEIPGPDTVDEFLYEINALHALNGAPNVIRVEGVVVDEHQEFVKGLLISYAEQGALVDLLYEQRGQISFARRERWAKQIIQGLCEIHETGYVQGDFTLSNIVIDENDDAQIIDINRRGCPVGWEPPEIAAKIESNQRISMYIGVKTDLYQLGMTLWALATGEDEPERQPRPLVLGHEVDVPDYYRRLVDICLSPMPRHRLGAKELLHFFPPDLLLRPIYRPHRASYISSDVASPYTPVVTESLYSPLPGETHAHNTRNNRPSGDSNLHRINRLQCKLSNGYEEGKSSTLTLAESAEDTDFAPRHSSASTLNHDNLPDVSQCPESPDTVPDLPSPLKTSAEEIQNTTPASWSNNLSCDGKRNGGSEITSSSKPPSSQDDVAESREQSMTITTNSVDHASQRASTPSHSEEHSSQPTRKKVSFTHQNCTYDERVASLFYSALPINPALNVTKRRSLPSIPKKSLVDLDGCSPEPAVFSLFESRLPINPAARLAQRKSLPTMSCNDLSPGHQSAKSEPVAALQRLSSFLLESQLPINPAFRERHFT
ncbi:hypothetical protein POX_e07184 [Penicillium oxalicum]|uniref:hypothetical protein n=1 Tax=Penicillium oxalicum TaxID=69781 RepID=UPI0020B6BCDD|nr:hypothetical protein POX_e07184 [Penicillium oxalicum]KAI2789156.1 hypothetical protein POX_e07184 [Penicillium oxalicum]